MARNEAISTQDIQTALLISMCRDSHAIARYDDLPLAKATHKTGCFCFT